MRLWSVIAAAFWAMTAVPAHSAGLVLIIANEDYVAVRDARGAAQVLGAESRLRAAGFEVRIQRNLDAPAMRAALSALAGDLRQPGNERVVIVFAGHVLHATAGGLVPSVWLMGADARSPDLATLDDQGLRLETVLAVASQVQGGALVALADGTFPAAPGARLAPGLAPGLASQLEAPQGVSVVRGPVGQITAFLRAAMVPGTNLGATVRQSRGLRIDGFDPPFLSFLPAGFEPAREADRVAWEAARAQDTLGGYEDYLEAFPSGGFVDAAQAAIEALLATPERIEAALELSRDERRAIQRDLTLLGFNTRGIDGIFGPGTRGSIRLWQEQNQLEDNGFLNRGQIFQLAAQAARRAAALEAEERERRAAEERRDRAFWAETGAAGDEPGLRAYLGRYPQGIFADLARERLNLIDADRARARAEQERVAWDAARAIDTPAAYAVFLADWPDGANAAQARARMEHLRAPAGLPGASAATPPELIARDRDEEHALGLAQLTRVLIERQLRAQGFDPGVADGSFDADTREALAGWQAQNGLNPTGFASRATIDGLLRGAVLRLFD